MRIFIIDRKKMGVIFVVIGLMVVLFSVGIQLDSRIRTTAFIQNNLGALKEYNTLEHKITYKLPAKWTTNQQSFTGGEILYHNNFTSQDGSVHGYVQVWNLQNDLESFLKNSKIQSKIQNESDDFKISDININGNKGYLVTYTTKSSDKAYKAFEYFVNYDNIFIRFAFYVQSDKLNNSMPAVFKAIVETIKYE